MKTCTWCKKAKPVSKFRKDDRRRDGRRNECRDCRRTYDREWKRDNPEPDRERRLMARYGLTLAEYDEMIERQNNRCAICGGEFNSKIHTLVPCVDHDHETGRVRGILHRNCNSAIGLLGDSPEICLAAAMYLRSA